MGRSWPLPRSPGALEGRLHGALSLLCFAALAVYTTLSIIWSLSPSDSWLEANRTFAYFAAFAGAIALVRLAPGRWAAVLNGITVGCLLVCGWALMTKVFPATFSPDDTFARLREPFGYWNAVGLTAAMAVPPVLWLAARRTGHPAANALAWPALGVLLTCLMLSYSRGALLALLIGLAVWFAVVPLRLRGIVPLLASALVVAPLVAWIFSRDALVPGQHAARGADGRGARAGCVAGTDRGGPAGGRAGRQLHRRPATPDRGVRAASSDAGCSSSSPAFPSPWCSPSRRHRAGSRDRRRRRGTS